jgi:hypothetical protein
VRSKQANRIRKQRHRPSKTQAVQEHLAQPELIFVIRLGCLNPGSSLAKELLGGHGADGNCSQSNLMVCGSKRKFPWTLALLPTKRTQRLRLPNRKPMQLFGFVQTQPLQFLSLSAAHRQGRFDSLWQIKIRPQLGYHADMKRFPQTSLNGEVDVSHVCQNKVRNKIQVSLTIANARLQKQGIPSIRRCRPRYQRNQQDGICPLWKPQTQRVLFITDEPSALAALDRASTNGGTFCRAARLIFF